MTVLTRRGMLGGAAAIAVGSLSGTPPARAAAPLIGKQGPSFYRYKVGDFEVTALNEGVVRNATPANMAVNKTLPDVQKALGDAFLPTDHVINQFNTIVVNTGRNLVLINSGFGDNGPPTGNNLLSNMSAAGIDPKNIDTILVSHFHGDHISGIRAKGGAANYPNAEIMVPSGEWQFWNDASNQAKVIDNFKPGFANVKRVFDPVAKDVKQFEHGKELVAGITALELARPQPRPHGVPGCVGQRQAACHLGHGQSPDPDPQSGLEPVGRHGCRDGGHGAQAPPRHGGNRQDPDLGLPPAVPVDRLHLEARRRLRVPSGVLAARAVAAGTPRLQRGRRSAASRVSGAMSASCRFCCCKRRGEDSGTAAANVGAARSCGSLWSERRL